MIKLTRTMELAITFLIAAMLLAGFIIYANALKDCAGKVNAKVNECTEKCMCPWEWDYVAIEDINIPFATKNK